MSNYQHYDRLRREAQAVHRQTLGYEQVDRLQNEFWLAEKLRGKLIGLFISDNDVAYDPELNKCETAQMLRIYLKQVEQRVETLYTQLNGEDAKTYLHLMVKKEDKSA